MVPISEIPGEVRVADELSDCSALIVRIFPALRAVRRVSLEAVFHLTWAAAAHIMSSFALVSVSVLREVCAYGDRDARFFLVVGIFALSAIFPICSFLSVAFPEELRGFLGDNQFICIVVFIVIWVRVGINAGVKLPVEVAELGVGLSASTQALCIDFTVRADIVRAES